MNVNLTNATDSPKATKVLGEVGDVSVESSEVGESEEGFFSKLASFILGENKPSKTSADSEVDPAAQLSDSSDESLVDTLLNSEMLSDVGSDDGGESNGETKPPPEQTNLTVGDTKQNNSKAELPIEANAKEFDSSKVMSDGDKILAKLNDATESLKSKHGNKLPTEDVVDQPSAPSMQQTKVDLPRTHKTDDETQQSVKQSVVSDSELSEERPVSAPAQFVTGQQSANVQGQVPEEVKVETEADKIVWRSPQPSLEPETQKTFSKAAKEELISEEDLARLAKDVGMVAHQPKSEHQSASNNQIDNSQQNPENVELPTIPVMQAAQIEDTDIDEAATLDPRQLVKNAQHIDKPRMNNQIQNVAPQLLPADSEVPQHLPKQVLQADNLHVMSPAAGPVKVELTPEQLASSMHHHAKTQQASLAQSVQQALSQQQLAQNVADRAMVQPQMPTQELNPTQMQHLASLAAAPVMVNTAHQQMGNHAALRSALAAKAVDGSFDGQAIRDGKEASGLANQIASASGQSGVTTTNSLRAEAAQTVSSPLQLTRDNVSDQMAEKVNMMMSKNLKNIDIRLDPPELGRMQIRLHMNGEGAGVHFTVANHQARDAIEQSLPRLREMLSQQGVQLGDTSVQQQSSGQQQRYTSSEDGFSQGGNGDNSLGEGENLEAGVNLDVNVTSKRDGISYYA